MQISTLIKESYYNKNFQVSTFLSYKNRSVIRIMPVSTASLRKIFKFSSENYQVFLVIIWNHKMLSGNL